MKRSAAEILRVAHINTEGGKMKRVPKPNQRVARGASPFLGVGLAAAEWYGASVRGLEALAFLERSREMAAEAVLAAPVRASAAGGISLPDRVLKAPPACL
jgi:hypothetical protein